MCKALSLRFIPRYLRTPWCLGASGAPPLTPKTFYIGTYLVCVRKNSPLFRSSPSVCVTSVVLFSQEKSSQGVRRPTGSTDPISRRTGQWLQLRLLDMRSEETDMDDCEYYE